MLTKDEWKELNTYLESWPELGKKKRRRFLRMISEFVPGYRVKHAVHGTRAWDEMDQLIPPSPYTDDDRYFPKPGKCYCRTHQTAGVTVIDYLCPNHASPPIRGFE